MKTGLPGCRCTRLPGAQRAAVTTTAWSGRGGSAASQPNRRGEIKKRLRKKTKEGSEGKDGRALHLKLAGRVGAFKAQKGGEPVGLVLVIAAVGIPFQELWQPAVVAVAMQVQHVGEASQRLEEEGGGGGGMHAISPYGLTQCSRASTSLWFGSTLAEACSAFQTPRGMRSRGSSCACSTPGRDQTKGSGSGAVGDTGGTGDMRDEEGSAKCGTLATMCPRSRNQSSISASRRSSLVDGSTSV